MKKKLTPKVQSAAVLTVRDAAEMSPEMKQEIATWLRSQAKGLLKEGDNYSERFTARYLYTEKA